MENNTQYRRRQYWVRSRFQLRYIASLMLQMSLLLACLGLMVYSHVTQISMVAETAPMVNLDSRALLQAELLDNVHGFYTRGLILIGITTVLLVVFGLFGSHKLAGPVVKLERHLQLVADGDLSRQIAFRREDYLDSFAETINSAVNSFQARREQTQYLAQNLAAQVQKLGDGVEVDELEKLVVELKEDL